MDSGTGETTKTMLAFAVVWLIGGVLAAGVPAPPNMDLALVDDLQRTVREVDGGLSCSVCDKFVQALHWIWARNLTEACVAKLVSTVCTAFHIQDHFICRSISSQYKGEVLYVMGQLFLEPGQICGLLFEDCGRPISPFSNWTIKIPANKPPVEILQPPKPGAPSLRVLQLSDIHVDYFYSPGSEVHCPLPLCCRKRDNKTVSTPAGFWGTRAKCDIPIWTLEDMLKHIARTEKLDYILWTGDLPPHHVWHSSKKEHVQLLKNLTLLFIKYFPDTPIFSAVGNHESVPADSFPPHYLAPTEFNISWLYDTLADQWGKWLPNSTENTIKWRASYSTPVSPGLRIISLNTQYCDTFNFWLYLNQTDPDGTLAWLVEELQAAERRKEKVHIIGHIPPGANCLHSWSRNYYEIVNRFESTIRAQFFGHTHVDSFAVFFDQSNPSLRATNHLFVGPSATTYSAFLPSYRIYTIDGAHKDTTWTVVDYETYVLNLTDANHTNKTDWKLEYKAKEAYNLETLFPDDFKRLINTMIANDSVFQKYNQFYSRGSSSCSGTCKHERLCELRSAKSSNSELCADIPQGFNVERFPGENLAWMRRRPIKADFGLLRDLWDVCNLSSADSPTTEGRTYEWQKLWKRAKIFGSHLKGYWTKLWQWFPVFQKNN